MHWLPICSVPITAIHSLLLGSSRYFDPPLSASGILEGNEANWKWKAMVTTPRAEWVFLGTGLSDTPAAFILSSFHATFALTCASTLSITFFFQQYLEHENNNHEVANR
jgi:hypothetical protein